MIIQKGVDMISGVGKESNIYLIDGELLVDTGTGDSFSDVKKYIESNYEVNKIKTIVNTHCHYDHTGGNKKYRDWLKASILTHDHDKASLETSNGTYAERFGGIPRVVTVDRALRSGNKIKTTNFSFEVLHTPGHSPGSICLYDKEKKILISGDTLLEDDVGRMDFRHSDFQDLIFSLQSLLKFQVSFLLPGHGPPKASGIEFHIKQMIAKIQRMPLKAMI